ncbi:hypothetical protein ACWENS_05530 [Streptomyces sp. NPDC004532]
MTEQPPPNLAEAMANVRTAMQQFARAYLDAMGPAMRAIAELAAQARAAETKRDRPAWQSPYGPPTRRH